MNIQVSSNPLESFKAEAIVVLFADKESFGRTIDLSLQKHIDFYQKALEAGTSKAEWFCTVEKDSSAKTAHLLLYSTSFCPPLPGAESLKTAAARCVEICRRYSLSHLVFAVMGADPVRQGIALMEGIFLGDFLDQRYKSAPEKRPELRIEFATTQQHQNALNAAVARHKPVLEAVNTARELVNDPNNHLTPDRFLLYAHEVVSRQETLSLTVLNHHELKAKGYNLIHAVGEGSVDKPALMVLRLDSASPKAKGDNDSTVYLVGKGVCFDTGGLCIKDNKTMHNMNGDMAGAAAVFGAMLALAKLQPRQNIVAIIPLAVNSISSTAVLPGSIVAAKNGRTVYIENTDAEGRLLLADAFCHLQEEGFKQGDYLIDFATLTAATGVALGDRVAAVFSDDQELASLLHESGQATGDHLWPLPLWGEYGPSLKHALADLCNMSQSPAGGAIHAANFLKEFVPEGARWAHIDMSRPARAYSPCRYYKEGATGFGVRLIVHAVEKLSSN